jgi:hypothetical protein
MSLKENFNSIRNEKLRKQLKSKNILNLKGDRLYRLTLLKKVFGIFRYNYEDDLNMARVY